MNDPPPVVPVRPAATLIVVRDSFEGLEVLMVRRHPGSVFQAGAWVFPGGAVDPSDAALAAHGLTDAEASTTLGVPSGGSAFFVAAARECFEEAGILLARPRPGRGREGGTAPDDLARHRQALLGGRRSLAQVLEAERLVLDLAGLHYVSRWVTPPGPPRRFDTRFFVAAAPDGQAASHDRAETVASLWTSPARALDRGETGDLHLVPPTVRHLEALARYPDTAGLLAAARSLDLVPLCAPELPCPT